MYCGNNANNPDLLNGSKTLGTRYGCLLKGKSFGFENPPDYSFLKPYDPIDKTKKYCGGSEELPVGYDRFGGLYECYLKGIGVGKKLKADAHFKKSRKSRKKSRKSTRKSTRKSRKSTRKSRKSTRKSKSKK